MIENAEPSRRLFRCSLIGLVFGLCLLSFATKAQYVLYFRSFGEWTVICSVDEPTKRKRCVLSAPAPSIPSPAVGPQVQIDILQNRRGGPLIKLRVHQVIDPEKPLVLRIDGNSAHALRPPRTGDVVWTGPEAGELLREMANGSALAVRFFVPGEETARERFFSLGDFRNALATYRETAKRIETG